MAIAMRPGEFRGIAAAVAGGSVGGIQTEACGYGQRLGQIQRVHGIQPVIIGGAAKIGRGITKVAQRVHDIARTGQGGINRNRKVGENPAECAVGAKTDGAVINTATGAEVIAQPQQRCAAGQLQAGALGHGIGGGAINRAIDRTGVEREHLASRIRDHELVAERRGLAARRGAESVVLEADVAAKG